MKRFLLMALVCSFMLSACGPGQKFGPSITPSATNTPTSTPTFTPSPTPTATPTPSPSATPTLKLPVLLETPMPLPIDVIGPESLTQVIQLASWELGGIKRLAISPDGQTLAIVTLQNHDGSNIEFRDISSGQRSEFQVSYYANYLAFSPDGKTVALSSGDSIFLLDIVSGQIIHEQKGLMPDMENVVFSQDGKLLIANGYKPSGRYWPQSHIFTWNVDSWKIRLSNCTIYGSDPYPLAISLNGLFATAALSRIEYCDSSTGFLFMMGTSRDPYVKTLAFSPDGKILASGYGDGQIKLWNLSTGLLSNILNGKSGGISNVIFSPDGKVLISSSPAGITFWDYAGGEKLYTLDYPLGDGTMMVLTQDGKLLITGENVGTINFWGIKP